LFFNSSCNEKSNNGLENLEKVLELMWRAKDISNLYHHTHPKYSCFFLVLTSEVGPLLIYITKEYHKLILNYL